MIASAFLIIIIAGGHSKNVRVRFPVGEDKSLPTPSSDYTSDEAVSSEEEEEDAAEPPRVPVPLCTEGPGSSYCSRPPNYPLDQVATLVGKNFALVERLIPPLPIVVRDLFPASEDEPLDLQPVDVKQKAGASIDEDEDEQSDIASSSSSSRRKSTPRPTQRTNTVATGAVPDDGYYENICKTRREQIKPRVAKNLLNETLFIVNEVARPGNESQASTYIQLISITRCIDPGRSCGSGEVSSSVITSCTQEYTEHKLLALDKAGKELVLDSFIFPSCCTCKIRRNLELDKLTYFSSSSSPPPSSPPPPQPSSGSQTEDSDIDYLA